MRRKNVHNRFYTIGEILFPILKKRGMTDKLEENELLKVWPKAVGNQICKQTKVSAFKNGTLFVKTTSSIWGQQLHFIKEEILKKINEITGQHLVKEIRFSVGHIPSSGVKVELSDSKDFLNERDEKMIEDCISLISDHELALIFQRVMRNEINRRRRLEEMKVCEK